MPELIRIFNTLGALVGILVLISILLSSGVLRPHYIFYMLAVGTVFSFVISVEYQVASNGYSLGQFLILAFIILFYAGGIAGIIDRRNKRLQLDKPASVKE